MYKPGGGGAGCDISKVTGIFSEAAKLKLVLLKKLGQLNWALSLVLTGEDIEIVAFVSNNAVLVIIMSH